MSLETIPTKLKEVEEMLFNKLNEFSAAKDLVRVERVSTLIKQINGRKQDLEDVTRMSINSFKQIEGSIESLKALGEKV